MLSVKLKPLRSQSFNPHARTFPSGFLRNFKDFVPLDLPAVQAMKGVTLCLGRGFLGPKNVSGIISHRKLGEKWKQITFRGVWRRWRRGRCILVIRWRHLYNSIDWGGFFRFRWLRHWPHVHRYGPVRFYDSLPYLRENDLAIRPD